MYNTCYFWRSESEKVEFLLTAFYQANHDIFHFTHSSKAINGNKCLEQADTVTHGKATHGTVSHHTAHTLKQIYYHYIQ